MKKTLLPIVLGFVAGTVSYALTQDFRGRDALGIIVLMFFVYLHKVILPKFGEKIETKDWVAIFFLSLCSWYVSWTLFLNI